MSVLLETTVGDIVIDLFTEQRPRACLNFLKLCKVKYYNFCLFHFVQRNFTAQTGDPTGMGKGGESIFRSLYGEQAKLFEAETKPRLKHKNRGTVSMVNNGTNMHGSQFFITLADDLSYLDGVHTVFGEVSEGFDILDKINETICDDSNRPYQDIRISHTVILDDPFDDPSGLEIPDRSPEPTKGQLESGRIGADEKIDDTEGKTVEEVEEMIAEREQKAGAQILEMIGDIPDADIKPPDNVLFVCKLNPVTTDEDLEIIFSRFGTITSCEIVKDQKSGESLQYAFIEFEKEEDCERAYFKMDNVLIDDRRIHVDFSQSVAHLKWKKQGAQPVLIDKKDNRPKFAVKNTSRKDNYDFVYDDDDKDKGQRKKDKEKHKHRYEESSHMRRKRDSSSSDDDSRRKEKRRKDDNTRKYKKDDKDTDRRQERRRYDSGSENEYRKEKKKDDRRRERRRDDSSDDERRRKENRKDDKRKERRRDGSDDELRRKQERKDERKKERRRDDSSSDEDRQVSRTADREKTKYDRSDKYSSSSSKERRHERDRYR